MKDNNFIVDASEELQTLNPLRLLSRGPLGTERKRQSFYKNNFTVIEPVEYVLNAQERNHTFVYVPILDMLSKLLERNEVLQTLERSSQHEGNYSSFRDGEYFKENKILSEEKGIALGLYIDDFEICNPLGTSKKSDGQFTHSTSINIIIDLSSCVVQNCTHKRIWLQQGSRASA